MAGTPNASRITHGSHRNSLGRVFNLDRVVLRDRVLLLASSLCHQPTWPVRFYITLTPPSYLSISFSFPQQPSPSPSHPPSSFPCATVSPTIFPTVSTNCISMSDLSTPTNTSYSLPTTDSYFATTSATTDINSNSNSSSSSTNVNSNSPTSNSHSKTISALSLSPAPSLSQAPTLSLSHSLAIDHPLSPAIMLSSAPAPAPVSLAPASALPSASRRDASVHANNYGFISPPASPLRTGVSMSVRESQSQAQAAISRSLAHQFLPSSPLLHSQSQSQSPASLSLSGSPTSSSSRGSSAYTSEFLHLSSKNFKFCH